MIYTYVGNKERIKKCQRAYLDTDGRYDVTIENISIIRKLFSKKYELRIELKGSKNNINKFNNMILKILKD